MPKAPATAAQVDLEYPGSAVTLQPLKKVQFGRANQMFCFNPLNGLIHAFHASALDKGKLLETFRSSVSEIIDEISCLLCRNHRCQHRQCLHLFGAARWNRSNGKWSQVFCLQKCCVTAAQRICEPFYARRYLWSLPSSSPALFCCSLP